MKIQKNSKPSRAKPRKPNPWAETMAEAAVILGHPLSDVQRAKRSGCTAFKSSRVHVGILEKWLDAEIEAKATHRAMAHVLACCLALKQRQAAGTPSPELRNP